MSVQYVIREETKGITPERTQILLLERKESQKKISVFSNKGLQDPLEKVRRGIRELFPFKEDWAGTSKGFLDFLSKNSPINED